ncbi:MAG: hypothetical protein ACI9EF_000161 [Pseudohongiellaceae bacterium]|jgi:hypothetical protein
MKTLSFIFVTGIFAAVLANCASTPSVPVPVGSRVMVRLYDANSGIELALANESHPGMQEVYSHARVDASLKLAPDELMGQLLASLSNNGFDRFAQDEQPPKGKKRSYLAVEHDGRHSVFNQPARSADVETHQAFARMKLLMAHYYTPVGSLQYVDNPEGGDIFGVGP